MRTDPALTRRFEAVAADVYEPLQRYLRRRASADDAADAATAYQALHAAFPDAMLYGRRIQWQTARPDTDHAQAVALMREAGIDCQPRQLALSMDEAFVHFVSRDEADRA